MRRLIVPSFAVALAATLAACSSTSTTVVAPNATPLTTELRSALELALLDERHAEAIYVQVLTDHGDITPFRNIVNAERQHAAAIEQLFRNRGLAVPTITPDPAAVPRFAAVSSACAAAADAEVANVELYDRYLGWTLPADVRTVFTNNRRASVENHLPAFTRCR